MVVEHIIPLVAGGTSAAENLCLSCYRAAMSSRGHDRTLLIRTMARSFLCFTPANGNGPNTLPGGTTL
jgi:hypothetical protein